jgi:hypothetical protein
MQRQQDADATVCLVLEVKSNSIFQQPSLQFASDQQ